MSEAKMLDLALKFESHRAERNLHKQIEYRKMLEWVMLVIEGDVYDDNAIIEEIEKVLK